MSKPYTVELTEPALADLAAIRDWLAENAGESAADQWIDDVLDKIDTLEQFPARGSIVPELAAIGLVRYRQLLFAPYRLIYRIRGNRVIVSLVIHGRRDLHSVLEQRLMNVR